MLCFSLLIGMHHCRRNKALISELSTPPPGSTDLYFPTQYSQNFLTQCMACLWKQHKSYWRNPSYTATRIFFTTVIALIFGTIFLDLGKKMWVPLLTSYNYNCDLDNLVHVDILWQINLRVLLFILSETLGRTCSILWDPCMQQFFSLEFRMVKPCNRLWTLSEQFSTEKRQLACTLLFPMLMHR